MRVKILKIVMAWVVLGAGVAVTTAIFFRTLQYYNFAQTAVETRATVTAKEPDNHGLIHYTYTVEGRSYTGTGQAGYNNPDFGSITIGQRLIAFYDPNQPWNSVLGDPLEHFNLSLQIVVAAFLLAPPFIISVLYRRLPRFRDWILQT